MPTRRISPEHPEPDVIREAAAHILAGRLVAFPTETVYGLGAHALDAQAVARIYEAKGRPAWNPLIVHLASVADVNGVASAWPEAAAQLAEAFWPGPLTIVVPRRAGVPDAVTAGLGSVALRVPSHPVAHALLVAAGVPIAAPSANRSTEVSPTRAHHVERTLGNTVAMILDAGPTSVGIESTVVDVRGARPVLLRPGGVSRPELERVVGRLAAPDAAPRESEPRASPGMLDRHYAPRARVLLFDASESESVRRALSDERAAGGRAGALVLSTQAGTIREAADDVIALPAGAAAYARALYSALHDLDDRGCTVLAIERPPAGEEWAGVRDRVERAAKH